MTNEDRQLVERITQQVLAALSKQGGAAATGPDSVAPADVRPPIGVCTGDYSKFPELAGRRVGASAPKQPAQASTAPAAAPASTPTAPAAVPLTGIVTAAQLQAALDTSTGGAVLLAPDARLSPLASDLARQHEGRIQRASAASAGGTQTNATNISALPWYWWIDGHCDSVRSATSARHARLRPSGASGRPSAMGQVVRELASLIKSRQVAGGVLFVHNAAKAACLANRCASIRAVVGTCGEAVEQGVNDLGANVLIIEYPHHGARGMGAMMDRVMAQPPTAPANVERDLADMHRCG